MDERLTRTTARRSTAATTAAATATAAFIARSYWFPGCDVSLAHTLAVFVQEPAGWTGFLRAASFKNKRYCGYYSDTIFPENRMDFEITNVGQGLSKQFPS